MACYSHSRISTFEQCRYKYKLQYIDKIKVDTPTTIEAFMGDIVHRTLQKLYSELQYQKLNKLSDLLDFYNQTWEKEFTENILIVKKEFNAENYRKMGEKYIALYYERYKPFDQMTVLGLETEERMTLSDGNDYHVRIDKLTCKGDTYYICDYKTNARMKDQDDADSDRQLAMYSMWVKDKYRDAKKVILLWHMLAFDKDITSERNETQLQKLMQEVVDTIKEMNSCTEWKTNTSALCDYCVYKSMCPSFKHEAELELKTVREFKDDDGVKMVDELAEIDTKLTELEKRKDEIRGELVVFATQKELDMVYGSNKKASVKAFSKIVYPEDMEQFIQLLKEKKVYDDVVMLSYPKLNSLILNKRVVPEIIDQVKTETSHRITLSRKREVQNDN
jgi:RecB family exonuclease